MRRPLLAATFAAACALVPAVATAQDEPEPEPAPVDSLPPNPCHEEKLRLRCPDLVMARPRQLIVRRRGGRVQLLAMNRIVNIGQGPLEVRATREHRGREAYADQVIHTKGGNTRRYEDAGGVYYKFIPGQGGYWKYEDAARFELWTLKPDGKRSRMVRTGPKVHYCFRDLERVRSFPRAPRARVYPACSQRAAGQRFLRLGTSPGWADIYPATYHENFISVTGLRGCYAFVHRADPRNHLYEEREDNNVGVLHIRLPPRGGRVGRC